ncbi:MAG: hypothetical protein GX375_00155 [Clostridiales bacterium]|nr:hypothetical protein [Clostridiales bacterium]
MVNTKKRAYTIGLIVLALIILGSAVLIWNIIDNNGKQQDKVYSGAKLIYNIPKFLDSYDGICG